MKSVFAFALLNSLLLGTPLAANEPTPVAQNILVILSDDQSVPHLGVYGNPDIKTPRLDALAAEGLRLDRAYVTCPQCAPSRSSFVTGRSPVAITTSRFSATVPREVKTMPDYTRAAGIYSGFAGRPYHMDGSRNTPEPIKQFARELGLITFPDRLDFLKESENDTQAVAQFREFLDAVPAGKRFYLQLGFSDPHRIFTAPKVHDPATLTLPPTYPDTPLVRADLAAYYDEVARLDGNVGRVLDLLAERGLAENTLVVFLGDNGASQFRGKGNLNEMGIRVPAIIRWPGHVKPGSSSATLFSGEDLTPTLLAAAGLPVPADMTGRNLLDAWLDRPFTPRTELFAERGAHGVALPWNTALFDLGRVVVTDRYKLIYNVTWQLPYGPLDFGGQPMWRDLEARHAAGTLPEPFNTLYFAPQRPMFELYDLQSDPWELKNLAGQAEHYALETELRLKLCHWMMQERDYAPLPLPEKAPTK
jgi:N-sulfoglucosamine sulfohydrolase